MVKVEGTLEEMYELFGDARQMVKDTKRAVRSTKKVASKVKRPLNSWQKFVKVNSKKPRFRLRSGKLNLKKLGVAFRKTPAGRKKKR